LAKLRRLFLSSEACSDLELIAEPLRASVIRRLKLLKKFPMSGAALAGKLLGWRATTVGIFRIFYRVTPRGIEVGYIRHCKWRSPEYSNR
jgi:hypothetical protein